jgi:hypothetical protein
MRRSPLLQPGARVLGRNRVYDTATDCEPEDQQGAEQPYLPAYSQYSQLMMLDPPTAAGRAPAESRTAQISPIWPVTQAAYPAKTLTWGRGVAS